MTEAGRQFTLPPPCLTVPLPVLFAFVSAPLFLRTAGGCRAGDPGSAHTGFPLPTEIPPPDTFVPCTVDKLVSTTPGTPGHSFPLGSATAPPLYFFHARSFAMGHHLLPNIFLTLAEKYSHGWSPCTSRFSPKKSASYIAALEAYWDGQGIQRFRSQVRKHSPYDECRTGSALLPYISFHSSVYSQI